MSSKLAVVAIGGNALIKDGQRGTIQEQMANALEMSRQLAAIVAAGWRLVVTHGNGPQVGFILLRSDRSADFLPRLPLDLCVADSQGGVGYIVADALSRALAEAGDPRPVAALLTRTVVSPADPAFAAPTKPIGPFLPREEAERHRDDDGWAIAEDAGRGWRRVVPSPQPLRIVELDAIAALVAAGQIVIAAGGGGIPVVEEGPDRYVGVEAVIDKDLASSLLAAALGADLLLISTGVPRVSIDFGKPSQRDLDRLTVDEARRHLAAGQFPPGSMGPKMLAAIRFLEAGGPEALITSP
ncbi:MAG TPA: carbamate kinase, partial [Thermomicrobiales bacterium]|nr:carbamate kinase [Thermomicrobiales bacterium]